MEACILADWFLAFAPDRLTHLKLQKLCFYGWGVARALDAGEELDGIRFEAWQHGPVWPSLWRRYRDQGAEPLPRPDELPEGLSEKTTHRLEQVWQVYGGLSAWQLRNQTHLEQPWIEASKAPVSRIKPQRIVEHFRALYSEGPVAAPTYVHGAGSFALDRIAVPRFEDWDALAAHCAHLHAA